MVQIANPIYDVVFKYLMKDEKLAKLLLSAIIGKEVLSLEFRPTEQTLSVSESLTVLRMDFSARIMDQEGRQELVLIELQKARMASDIMRFRRYLGSQYASKENVIRESAGESYSSQRALPILSIYILGEPLPKIKVPVVRVNRVYTDAATGEQLHEKEEFIESLTHDSIVIQVHYLKGRRRNELEQLLSIFDQSLATRDPHLMLIDEQELPGHYRPLLRRLQQAMSNSTIRETMEAEDEVVEDLRVLERRISEQEVIIEKKDEALQEKEMIIEKKDEALQEKEMIIEKKDEALQEKEMIIEKKDEILQEKEMIIEKKDEILQEKEAIIDQQQQQMVLAIRKSHAAGLDISALSAIFNLNENEIKAIMEKYGSR